MSAQAREMSYAVRFRVLGKYYGQLCRVLALLTLAPLGVALLAGEPAIAWRYGILVVVLAGGGHLLTRLQASRRVQVNEALILSVLAFSITPLLMTFPMMGAGLSFVDALFEAISSVTTTGLSTLPTVEQKSLSFLFARAWMQWSGGLGIVVLSLALAMRPGITAKCLAVTENTGDDLVGGTKAYARHALTVYAVLTGAGILALLLTGNGFFNAVLYSLAAISTGGFAPHDASLAHFAGPAVPWLTILICLAGALPLSLYHLSWRQGWKNLWTDLQFKALLLFSLTAVLALALSLHFGQQLPWKETWYHAPLVALSAQSTAGFTTMAPGGFDASAKMILILTMAVGGGIGSTAGGIKLVRLLILFRLLYLALVRTCLSPHAVLDPSLAGKRLQDTEIYQALLFILLFLGVVILSWFPFLFLGYDPMDALFEVVSATGTVGLSTGITGPQLPVLLKTVLCIDMLMGRLEILAWLVILFPRTWFGKKLEEKP